RDARLTGGWMAADERAGCEHLTEHLRSGRTFFGSTGSALTPTIAGAFPRLCHPLRTASRRAESGVHGIEPERGTWGATECSAALVASRSSGGIRAAPAPGPVGNLTTEGAPSDSAVDLFRMMTQSRR